MKSLCLLLSFFAVSQVCAGWRALSVPTTGIDYYGISFVNTYTGWAVGMAGTIIKTTNGGKSWMKQYSGASSTFYAVQFVNAQKGWAVSADGGVRATTDGGATWKPQAINNTAELRGVSFLNDSLGFVSRYGNVNTGTNIFKTTNGGTTWTAPDPFGAYIAYNIKIVSKDIALLASNSGIWKSINGGSTWVQKSGSNAATMYAIDMVDSTTAVAVGEGGAIYRSVDLGETWSALQPVSATLRNVSFSEDGNGWIVGDGGFINSSSNGGVSWAWVHGISPQTNWGISGVNRGRVWLCGAGNVVGEYTDNNYSLEPPYSLFVVSDSGKADTTLSIKNIGTADLHISLTLDDSVFSITSPKKFVLYAGKTAAVSIHFISNSINETNYASLIIESEAPVKFVGLGGYYRVASVDERNDREQPMMLAQNYPNPLNRYSLIGYQLNGSHGKFEVKDMLGRVVYRTALTELEGNVRFDASQLPNGVYLYTVTDGKTSETKKMVISK